MEKGEGSKEIVMRSMREEKAIKHIGREERKTEDRKKREK